MNAAQVTGGAETGHQLTFQRVELSGYHVPHKVSSGKSMAVAIRGPLTASQRPRTWSLCPRGCGGGGAVLTPGQGLARVDGSELGSGPWVLACTSAQGSFLSKSGPEKVVLAEKLQRS